MFNFRTKITRKIDLNVARFAHNDFRMRLLKATFKQCVKGKTDKNTFPIKSI